MQSLNKQLFLNLTVDSPDKKHFEVPATGLLSLWIIEDLSQLVPVCTFVYEETYSEFSELFPLLGNETLTVDIGLNKDKYRTFKFTYFSYETRSKSALLARNKEIQTNWVDYDFIKLRQYPSSLYFNQVTASDVVKSISTGLTIDIESTRGTGDYFLNNMVIGEAIKDLSNESYNSEGSTFAFYKNNSRFKFNSRNCIMRQSTKNTFVHGYDLMSYVLYGNDRSLFTNPESTVVGYSYENGNSFEFTKDPANLKSMKASFGKSIPFGEGTNISSRFVYDGTRYIHEAEAKATSATESYMDSAMRMTFVAVGQPSLSCGDIVEISVGSSLPSYGKQNMLISGKWLVEKIVHYVANYNYMVKVFVSKPNTDFSRRKAIL